MIRKFLHIAWIIFFLVQSLFCFSQIIPKTKTTVDRYQILIGEPISLTIEATIPAGSNISWFSLDSIAHFDFIEKGKVDSVDTTGGKSYRQHFVITSFDSGTHFIPALPFVVNNKKFFTDSARIEVGFSKFDPQQDYHDIKDIIDVPNPNVVYIIWFLLVITLLSAGLLVYLLMKKQIPIVVEPEPERPVSKLSPYEEAMKSMEALKKEKLPESGQTKLFYTRLNDILRLFVLRKLQISSLEKTNEELILQLRELNLSREQFSHLAESLRMSDFVKFAKYLPGQNDNEQNFSVIESSIQILNKTEK
ncbi:MAG: hypothetical protein JST75_14460 [Bacteroidetes bacterium]|nr:hypothetical protein [Bacteroidota bacterium]